MILIRNICYPAQDVLNGLHQVLNQEGMSSARSREAAQGQDREPVDEGLRRIALVGTPNVGKSATFNALTGAYVTVSNYPGTTVDVGRGRATLDGRQYEVLDSPGMYSLLPITDEERVARTILIQGGLQAVVHTADAKNLERMLPLTLQLVEAGIPVVLAVNMMDEAERSGLGVDVPLLEERLGIPVVATAATLGRGIPELREAVLRAKGKEARPVEYTDHLEHAAGQIRNLLGADYGLSPRAIALLVLQGDEEMLALVEKKEGEDAARQARTIAEKAAALFHRPPTYQISMARRERARELLEGVVHKPTTRAQVAGEWLSRLCSHPVAGLPILAAVLYFLFYKFVGGFGAGTLVGFLENGVFGRYVNPGVNSLAERFIPWQPLRELVGMDYGVITLGLRYAVAIVFPIVGTFFLAFAVVEDSGYLPRLALLVDRLFKRIGLSGRAVIPMVLGFGCDTMATMVTRTLETRREKIIATFLLSLAIPCSAQLGLVLSLMNGHPGAFAVWAGVVGGVMLLIGWLTAKLLPGPRPTFFMEVPPLRLPRLSHILVKTYARMQWYFLEVLPLFLLASVVIWLGRLPHFTSGGGLFGLAVSALRPLVGALDLPPKAAEAFLFGFFRRDYGAAGLYVLASQGAMTGKQILVAVVTLTLFVPCVAQFAVMIKEQGARTALGMVAFIFPFAFGVGYILNWVLTLTGANL